MKHKLNQYLMTMIALFAMSIPCSAADALAQTKEVDYSYISAEAIVALTAYPNRVLTNPDNKLYPIEVIKAAGLQELGMDPVDIESVLLVLEPPMNSPAPGVAVIVKTLKEYSLEKLLPTWDTFVEGTLNGKTYLKHRDPMGVSIYKQDEKTIIFGLDSYLEKVLATHENPVDSPLKSQIPENALESDILLTLHLDPVKPMLGGFIGMAPIPPELEDLRNVPELVSFIQLRLNLDSNLNAKLSLFSKDDDDGELLESILSDSIKKGREMFLAEMPANQGGAVEEAMNKYMKRLSEHYANQVQPKREGNEVYVQSSGNSVSYASTTGVLVALLLPAVQQAREAARRTQSTNILKQIGLAFHNYHDVYTHFPARASIDENGKPLLSWRVHILPFIEQNALYQKFKLDEPWDSEHNKQLISEMPQFYMNPSLNLEPGKTTYLVPVGQGTVFEANEGLKIRELTDGTSNTIMAVEADADQAVIWTKPDDLKYDPSKPLNGLGNIRPGGFNVLFCDGSVRLISPAVSEEILKALFTYSGGEPVNSF